MKRRVLSATIALVGVATLCGGAAAQTQYNYGGGGYGGGDSGILIFFEGGVANPRNTDNIVAAVGPNVVIPEWDDEFAGRLGGGYEFGSGSKIVVSYWGFEATQDAADTGAFEFPIGPTDGIAFDVETEIQVSTADVGWSFSHGISDAFSMEWTVGLRWASFEETTSGVYNNNPLGPLAVAKSNEGTMYGPRVAGRATYRRGSYSGSAAVGLSMLDGELESSASLAPQPGGTSPLDLTDDSRTGTIYDLDLRAAWHNARDNLSIWLGWEQQKWEDIVTDLARNVPGSEVIARDRDSVSFSWIKLGVSFKF